jgi:hypothetical protein
MRRVGRTLSVLVVLVTSIVMAPLVDVGSVASGAPIAACAAAQVTLSATADQSLYTSGAVVHVTIALHNHSTSRCFVATGTFSPSFTLSNAAGVTVWGSCWFGGGPAPCAYYLRQTVLAPGATYRVRPTWDQRTGHPDLPVAAGRYVFRTKFSGLPLRATTTLNLSRSHDLTATLADSGHRYALAVGDLLTIRLLATSMNWTTAVSTNPGVLSALPEVNPVAGLFTFRAIAPGTAGVSTVGNPACYPQCLMASRLFFVTVSVHAP